MRKYDFTLDLESDNSNSLIIRRITPGSTVLEFGPAHGRMTRHLKEQLRCAVTVVELDAESGAEAAKYAEHALLGPVDGDIESGRWSDLLSGKTYDHIIFADVLEHLRNPSKTLATAKAHLAERGTLHVSVPNICHNSILIELWQNRFAYRPTGLLDETHVHFFSKANLARIVHENGLLVHFRHNARNAVANTEFKHSLSELPPAVAAALAAREDGDTYQHVWELKHAPWAAPGAIPKISVLIPTYNYARYLPEAIESVLDQDLPDFELIISDDASSDNSADIIRAYAARDPRIKVHLHEKNLGMVANWNFCLHQARGQYIKYLFGDDRLVTPHALRTLANALDHHPDTVLASSARQIIDQNSRPVDLWHSVPQNGRFSGKTIARHALFKIENVIGEPSAVMFRAAAADRSFDTDYRQVVDLEMWLHLLRKGDFFYFKTPLCQFRRHQEQQTAVNHQNQTGFHEHKKLLATYLPFFAPPGSSTSFREKRLLHQIIHCLEFGKDVPAAARLLAPDLKKQFGPPDYDACKKYFWFLRKLTRPFCNGHRAWRKHILKDPSYWRAKTKP